MTPLHTVERELLLHADALRLLATDLVGARAADDLVQETAVRALRSPPPEPQRLFAWLATILRHLASKHRRSQRRREARERRAARDEALPPADALLERRDMLRRVTDAVLALPEPYQATLIRRYFEELTPTAIAQRDGVPLATVKSRLQRGLALLRTGLDRERADWRRALLGLTGAALLPSATGILLMTTTTKLVTAAGALLAAVLWFALSGAAAPPPRTDLAAASPNMVAAAAGALTNRTAAARTEIPPADATPAELSHPFAFELQCTVVDHYGLPVRAAMLFAAPRGCALDIWPQMTGDDGVATLVWRGKQAPMTMAIGARCGQLQQELQEVVVQAGSPQQLVLLVEQSVPSMQLAEEPSSPASSAADQNLDCERRRSPDQCRSCHQEPQLRSLFEGRFLIGAHLHPEASFADLLLPSPSIPIEELGEYTTSGLDDLDGKPRPDTHLAGVVFGADGKPADGVLLAWSGDDGSRGRLRTSHGGQFALDGVAPGSYSLHAGGDDAGPATATVTLAAGDHVRRELLLTLGAVIRGRAIGADGQPLDGWRVQYVGERWCDACTTHADGSFILPNLPTAPGKLLLWGQHGTALPAAVEPSVLPDNGEVLFDLRQRGAPKGRLRLFAALPDGIDHTDAEVRVWQQDSSRGAAMLREADGSFALANLAPGFYRIEIGVRSCGWRDLAAQWVDGKGLADLGRIELLQPGHVRITRGNDIDGLPEFCLRRPDCDVRAEEIDAAAADELAMPAGEWLCLWKTKAGALRSRAFTLRSGATVDLHLDRP